MRLDTDTENKERASFILIGCERSWKYRAKKDLVWTFTGSKKCGCSFKLWTKPVVGGERWMLRLICESHNHALTRSLVGHPYVGC